MNARRFHMIAMAVAVMAAMCVLAGSAVAQRPQLKPRVDPLRGVVEEVFRGIRIPPRRGLTCYRSRAARNSSTVSPALEIKLRRVPRATWG